MNGPTLAEVLATGSGLERAFLCPVHGDNRPSASVNVTTGLWHCFTCGASGKAGEGTYEIPLDALEELARELGRVYTPMIYAESWLNIFDAGLVHPYWLGRFSPEACRHFRLGYDISTDAVTYPFRNANAQVLGVVRRPLHTVDGPKYLYPRGLKVGDYLFNYTPEARRVVVLVEGAADAIALWDAGIDAFAIYGARISARQVALLRRTGAREVLCAFDADEAGRRAYSQVVETVTDMLVTPVTWDPDLGKDVAELPVKTRQEIFASLLEKTGEDCSLPPWHSGSSGSTATAPVITGSRQSSITSRLGRLKIRRMS